MGVEGLRGLGSKIGSAVVGSGFLNMKGTQAPLGTPMPTMRTITDGPPMVGP